MKKKRRTREPRGGEKSEEGIEEPEGQRHEKEVSSGARTRSFYCILALLPFCLFSATPPPALLQPLLASVFPSFSSSFRASSSLVSTDTHATPGSPSATTSPSRARKRVRSAARPYFSCLVYDFQLDEAVRPSNSLVAGSRISLFPPSPLPRTAAAYCLFHHRHPAHHRHF